MTPQVKVKVIVELAGKVGITKPAACNVATSDTAGQMAPPAAPQVTDVQLIPDAAGSLTMVPSAADGPPLVAVMV